MSLEHGGTSAIKAIFGVLVPGRAEGFYLFADLHDAEDFAWAVRDHGNVAELSEELLYPYLGAGELIEAEVIAGATRLALFPAGESRSVRGSPFDAPPSVRSRARGKAPQLPPRSERSAGRSGLPGRAEILDPADRGYVRLPRQLLSGCVFAPGDD